MYQIKSGDKTPSYTVKKDWRIINHSSDMSSTEYAVFILDHKIRKKNIKPCTKMIYFWF